MNKNTNILLLNSNQGIIENTNIYFGSYELIDSRSILYFNSDFPLEIEETFYNTFKVRVRIISKKNDSSDEHRLDARVYENNTIEYTCINFNNPFGTGTVKPIEIGNVGERKIFIHFWIFALSEEETGARRLEYSIWMERKKGS